MFCAALVMYNSCCFVQEWAGLLSLASQPGESLEQLHVFCLAHVLRRPIIVYGFVSPQFHFES